MTGSARRQWNGVLLGAIFATWGPAMALAEPPIPDQREQTIEISDFGRHAIRAVSAKGAGLRLIDRMAGPVAEDGSPGRQDGRIDSFLGAGAHKLVVIAADKAAAAEIEITPFRELHNGQPQRLNEFETVASDLDDLQQRSYWLDIRTRQTVFIEAAGRKLADLRLWKDGSWMVDAEPVAMVTEPVPRRPLALRRLVVQLDPGRYQLTAYGGPGVAWTEQAIEQPLFIRWGVPRLSESGRRRAIASPFGLDHYLVPKTTTAFGLELPEPGDASIEVTQFEGEQDRPPKRAIIEKTLRQPKTDFVIPAPPSLSLVTVEREAGKAYVLQHFQARRSRVYEGDGNSYVVTTLRPGSTEDAPDLGAIVTETAEGKTRIVAAKAIPLQPSQAWKRRFNLMGPVSLYFDVKAAGRYTVSAQGMAPDILVAPFLPDAGYKPLPSQRGGGDWDLEAGIYELTLQPRADSRGIVTLSLRAAGTAEAAEESPVLAGATFPSVTLVKGRSYRVTASMLGEEEAGFSARRLPFPLAEDLAVVVAPGERFAIPVTLPGAGQVEALDESGQRLRLALDKGAEEESVTAAQGPHSIAINNPTAKAAVTSLHFVPSAPPASKAPVSEASKAQPDFPVLEPGTARFLDLGRRNSATFAVKVDKPALYRLESTGLLETQGTLRTRTRPALAEGQANGIGRNFRVRQYLREGLYQLTLATRGETTGHLGVTLAAAPVREGGSLVPGLAARASLSGDEAIAYGFEIGEAGKYRLSAVAPSGEPELRLEDAEGWPLTRLDQGGTLEQELRPGRYRLLVLPQPLPGRVVTTLERIAAPAKLSGHGPHALPLDGHASNRWEEPQADGPRVPDTWTFTLPAPVATSLTLSPPMAGVLWRGDAQIAAFGHAKPFAGRLEEGAYRLEVQSERPNNRVDYTVSSTLRELTPGRERIVEAPADVPIAIGTDSLVEIASFGGADVRAVLTDAAGKTIARADDRPDDWNFSLVARLAPGRYGLRVEPVGAETASTTIRLSQFEEITDQALTVPGDRILNDAALHAIPLELPNSGDVLVVAAKAGVPVGLTLERREDNGAWRPVGSALGQAPRLLVPRAAGAKAAWRVLAWGLDHVPTAISLQVRAVATAPVSEELFAEGLRLADIPGIEPPLAVGSVTFGAPGLFRIEQAPPGLLTSRMAEMKAMGRGAEIQAAAERLWFANEGKGAVVRGVRVVPNPSAPLKLTLDAGESIVLPVTAPSTGPVLVVADSQAGQPGLAIGEDARFMGVAEGAAALVVADAKAARIRLWRADEGDGALPLALTQMAFAAPSRASHGLGISEGTLEAKTAREVALPTGSKLVRLVLPRGMAAALIEDNAVTRTFWPGAEGLAETLESAAQTLLLLNAGPDAARYSLFVAPAGDSLSLKKGVLASLWRAEAGSLQFDIAAEPGQSLSLLLDGAVERAVLVQKNGKLRSGKNLTVDSDAVLRVRHGPGLVAAWLDGSDSQAWPSAEASGEALPAAGVAALSGSEKLWRVEKAEPALMHLSTSAPVLAGLRRPQATPEISVWPRGAGINAFLPKGATLLGLRGLGQAELAGNAHLAFQAPTEIAEGLGPKAQLGPGEARLFAFTLAQAGPIGVGVRGSAETAKVRLLDEAGAVLAEGSAAMKDLGAGRYFLLVETRADGGVAEIQPALVGTTRPPATPPEDIKRFYWDLVSKQG